VTNTEKPIFSPPSKCVYSTKRTYSLCKTGLTFSTFSTVYITSRSTRATRILCACDYGECVRTRARSICRSLEEQTRAYCQTLVVSSVGGSELRAVMSHYAHNYAGTVVMPPVYPVDGCLPLLPATDSLTHSFTRVQAAGSVCCLVQCVCVLDVAGRRPLQSFRPEHSTRTHTTRFHPHTRCCAKVRRQCN
jgi:hypothetical protein